MESEEGTSFKEIASWLVAFCVVSVAVLLRDHNWDENKVLAYSSHDFTYLVGQTAETAIRNSYQPSENIEIGWRDVIVFCKSPDSDVTLYRFIPDEGASTQMWDSSDDLGCLAFSLPSLDKSSGLEPLVSKDQTRIYVVEVRESSSVPGHRFGPVYAVKLGDLNTEMLLAGLPL